MRMHFDVHGDGDGRPSVLLSSGLGGSAAYWRPQMQALLDAGWRVVTYDHAGTGRSPAALPEGYRIEDMAADVLDVMARSGTQQCHFVGHALGGLVGLQLALEAPGRIASLALVNAWSRPDSHSARCFDARIALLRDTGPRAYVEAQPIFLYPAWWAARHEADVRAEVEHALAVFPGVDNMLARIGALRAFDIDARLSGIAVPTLIAAARDDTLVPWTCSQRLAQRLPAATLVLAEHGGHAHSVVTAEAFNTALLAFLKER